MNSGSGGRTLFSRLWVAFFAVVLMASAAVAQGPAGASDNGAEAKPVIVAAAKPVKLPEAASSHRFWNRENAWLFAGIGASRALDYASTRNMQRRGREEMLLPDDVANNTAAFVAVEAGGAVASICISYLLHRTGHHKLERWLSIGHISVTTFGAAHNYALESRHP